MKKESTYQKYKRERDQLRNLVHIEMQNFVLNINLKEYEKRINYLRKCINHYRFKK